MVLMGRKLHIQQQAKVRPTFTLRCHSIMPVYRIMICTNIVWPTSAYLFVVWIAALYNPGLRFLVCDSLAPNAHKMIGATQQCSFYEQALSQIERWFEFGSMRWNVYLVLLLQKHGTTGARSMCPTQPWFVLAVLWYLMDPAATKRQFVLYIAECEESSRHLLRRNIDTLLIWRHSIDVLARLCTIFGCTVSKKCALVIELLPNFLAFSPWFLQRLVPSALWSSSSFLVISVFLEELLLLLV